jgi:aspartate kinase
MPICHIPILSNTNVCRYVSYLFFCFCNASKIRIKVSPSHIELSLTLYPVVSQKECITILNVRSHGTISPQRFLSQVSNCLEVHDIIIDLISSSQQMLSLAICAPEPQALDQAIKGLEEIGDASLLDNMSIVSVIGQRMRNVVGIGAEIFSALARARVNIYLISQGASEINISYVLSNVT